MNYVYDFKASQSRTVDDLEFEFALCHGNYEDLGYCGYSGCSGY